jgi:hypothetical protein
MACCNKRRAQLASRPALAAARAATTATAVRATATTPAPRSQPGPLPGGRPEVQLRFTGSRRVRVEGAVSGRIYRASPTAPLLVACPEDVRSLLRTGYFARA